MACLVRRVFKDFAKWDQLHHKKNPKTDKNVDKLVVYHAKLGWL